MDKLIKNRGARLGGLRPPAPPSGPVETPVHYPTDPPAVSSSRPPTAGSSRIDRASAATPKTRSRAEGAAVALDELDRRLLNLMQGSFPLEPKPYAAVARAAEIPEEQALERVRRLLGERIIRQVTPIYD